MNVPYYQGHPYQRGRGGLLDILSGFGRSVIRPWLSSGAKKLAPYAAKLGASVLSDVAKGRNVKQSLKRRGMQVGESALTDLATSYLPVKRRRRNQTGRGLVKRTRKAKRPGHIRKRKRKVGTPKRKPIGKKKRRSPKKRQSSKKSAHTKKRRAKKPNGKRKQRRPTKRTTSVNDIFS